MYLYEGLMMIGWFYVDFSTNYCGLLCFSSFLFKLIWFIFCCLINDNVIAWIMPLLCAALLVRFMIKFAIKNLELLQFWTDKCCNCTCSCYRLSVIQQSVWSLMFCTIMTLLSHFGSLLMLFCNLIGGWLKLISLLSYVISLLSFSYDLYLYLLERQLMF